MNQSSHLWVPLGAAFIGAVSALATGTTHTTPLAAEKRASDSPSHPVLAELPMETAVPPPEEMAEEQGGEPHPLLSAGPVETSPPITELSRAEGDLGRTIREIEDQVATLDGKPVRVRAVVRKAIGGVMGKNFLHLSDGSKNDAGEELDLPATSVILPEVGSTVLLEGTIKADVDLGASLRYPVLLTDARSLEPDALPLGPDRAE